MKKHLLTILGLSIASISSFGQDYCRILTDSVESGNGATSHSYYYYNADSKLVKKEKVDSNSVTVNYMDTVIFNIEGRVDSVISYENWTGGNYHTISLEYDGQGRIVRADETGDNGSPWRKTYDLLYNTDGDLESMEIDQSTLTGTPEGIAADWLDLVWDEGNIISATMSIDVLGFGTPDLIEMNISYDTLKNLSRLKMLSDPMELIFRGNKNNMTSTKFANDENIGGFFSVSAGTAALQSDYTYNTYDEAKSEEMLPTILQTTTSKTSYTFDCSISLGSAEIEKSELIVYPNPASSNLTIEAPSSIKSIKVVNMQGKLVYSDFSNKTNVSLNIIDLPRGIYFVMVNSGNQLITKKIIKE